MTTTTGKVPARFRASPHIGFSVGKNRMIRNNADVEKRAKDTAHFQNLPIYMISPGIPLGEVQVLGPSITS
jgi:hypothetical protein